MTGHLLKRLKANTVEDKAAFVLNSPKKGLRSYCCREVVPNASYIQYIRFTFLPNIIPEHNVRAEDPQSVQLQNASLPMQDSRNHARPRTYRQTGFVTHAYLMFKSKTYPYNIIFSYYLTRTHYMPITKCKLLIFSEK